MYQEIFGVEDDLFAFARCGAIAYEPEIYDDEQLREKNYIFSTGRSNRDYGFLDRLHSEYIISVGDCL